MNIVKCNNCKEDSNIECSEIIWDRFTNIRNEDEEIHHHGTYEYTCTCGNEIELKLEYCEYPPGVLNHSKESCDGGVFSGDCCLDFSE